MRCKYTRVIYGYKREGEKTNRQSNIIEYAHYFSEVKDVVIDFTWGECKFVPECWNYLKSTTHNLRSWLWLHVLTLHVSYWAEIWFVGQANTYIWGAEVLTLLYIKFDCWTLRALCPPGRVYYSVIVCCAYPGITCNHYLGVLHYTTLCFRTTHNTACVTWT